MRNFKLIFVLSIFFVVANLFYNSCQKNDPNLVKINFNFDYTLTWDINKSDFKQDANYDELSSNFSIYKHKIILSVLDTTSLSFDACFKSKSAIRKGDLSIILINSIEKIQFSKIFEGSQYDHFIDCKYPIGLFDRIEMNRVFFIEKLLEKDNEIFFSK